jgi:predicted acyl esterase
VNYEVMGANVWKHAPSFAAMGNHTLRFHLSSVRSGDGYLLSQRQPVGDASIPQTVNLADRADVDRVVPGGGIVDKAIDTWNGIEFVSEPLTPAIELSGLFSGRLDFITNKKDFDFTIQLYELTPKGAYVQLSYILQRASYIKDRSHRQLLTPERRMRLYFKSERLTSRQFQAGSRLVVVLSIVKESDIQINYGTGKDVSDESIVDAKDPLFIKWFDDSVINIPVNLQSATALPSPRRQQP